MQEWQAGDERPARLTAGIVGAGPAGWVLARALQDAGHRVVAASAGGDAAACVHRGLLPAVPLCAPEDVVERCDLVLLTVPDDVLAAQVAALTQAGCWQAGQIVVHTCLSAGAEALDPARAGHVLPVSLYPAMRFTGTPGDLDRLRAAAVAVSADPRLRPIGEALVIEMGAEPVWVEPAERTVFRAAVTHAAVAVQVALAEAHELLARAGIGSRERLLATLAASVADDALANGSALAGPGDPEVIRQDLATLLSLGASPRALHVSLIRSQLSGAVFGGRLDAARIAPVLAALGDHGGPGPGE